MAHHGSRSGGAGSLQHALIPLSLALAAIRHSVYRGAQGPSADGLAGLIAASVPIYEYYPDRLLKPRVLRQPELRGAMFKRDGTELHFQDGRAPLSTLAVRADDIECVVQMLKDPAHAARIQSRWVKQRAKGLRARAAELARQASNLRRRTRRP